MSLHRCSKCGHDTDDHYPITGCEDCSCTAYWDGDRDD